MIHNAEKFNNKIMKNFSLLIKIIVVYLFLISNGISKESIYYSEGIKFFKKKEFDKSKILFERDIVFNPKSEKSYLFLAKIFNNKNNDDEQEINLNSVLLLNPQNDEAIYMLTLLKIKQSDYNQAKKSFKNVVIYKPQSSRKNLKKFIFFVRVFQKYDT